MWVALLLLDMVYSMTGGQDSKELLNCTVNCIRCPILQHTVRHNYHAKLQ